MRLKKTGAWMLTAVMALNLAACGGRTTETATESAQETSAVQTENAVETSTSETENGTGGETSSETGETELPEPVIEAATLTKKNEDGEQELVSVIYDEIYLMNEGYSALAGTLAQNNREAEKQAEEDFDTISEAAEEGYEESKQIGGTFAGYVMEKRITVTRADAKIFSYRTDSYENTGGAHPMSGSVGASYDSQTGKKLQLSDVVSDKNGLYDKLIEKLEAFSEENGGEVLFDGYQDMVRSQVDEDLIEGTDTKAELQWTLSDTGMTVYFNPYDVAPYAAGQITIELPYAENEALFTDAVQ